MTAITEITLHHQSLDDEILLSFRQRAGAPDIAGRFPHDLAYCGASDRPLQRDCVLAVSRGGRYTLDNVVPACGSCNASKCNYEVTGWLRRRRLDERAFLIRHLEIRTALGSQPGPEAAVEPSVREQRG